MIVSLVACRLRIMALERHKDNSINIVSAPTRKRQERFVPSDFFRTNNEPAQRRETFVASIKCQCGQSGSASWDENVRSTTRGARPVLLEVSSGFYFRVQ